jgi:trigger factor
MSVVLSLEDVGPCRKQLTVEVPAPAVEAETERVIEEYGRRVRIPGFRKGKVPAEMVRRRFAKDIEREVVDRLLPRYWRQAQAESSIEPLLPPEVEEVREREPGEPLTFVATVETRPQIELRNLRDFDLPNPAVEPGTLEVDDTLENLRRQLGTWVTVDRPAARGDLVRTRIAEITAAAAEAPEATAPDAGDTGDPVAIELGDPQVWEELTLALSGLAAGQETTFTRREEVHLHGPGEHEAGAYEGGAHETRERRFRVRVDEVQERELAPLDDAFASRVSPELASVEALRQGIARQLGERKASERRQQRQQALLDQLRERHPLELPQGVVRHELEQLVKEYAGTLARRGVDLDRAGIDWNRFAGDMAPRAEQRVHERLLLDAVAEAEGVDLTDEEFERALAAFARVQGTSTPALRRSLDENGRLTTLRAQLRRDKTIRHLLGELGEETSAASPGPAL